MGEQFTRTAKSAPSSTTASVLQRKCDCGQHAAGGECTDCEKKKMPLQRKSNGIARSALAPPIVHDVLRSPGRPLDAETRAFFEPRFRQDFSSVRVHTDTHAAQSAQAVKALAYTVGSDVVFGAGRYLPHTAPGRRLLAHELSHVIQQNSTTGEIQYQLEIGQQGDRHEREADEKAELVMNNQPAGGLSHLDAHRSVLQRAETDTSAGCSDLADTQQDINARINQSLTNARGTGTPNAATVIGGLKGDLADNKETGRTGIEVWAKQLGSSKVRQPQQEHTKYKDVSYGLWRQSWFPILNPTMRVKNICIGSDKLGHFLQQGLDYFKLAHQPGKSPADAEQFGRSTEAGGFGLSSTGVFSNADLEANRQGLRFYEELAADPSMTFDIGKYLNDNWNEETNPSHYEASVGPTVWRNLLNGSWRGTFTSGGSSIPAIVNLTVAGDGMSLTGEYLYKQAGEEAVRGTVANGRVTHQKNALGAVTGVQIDFEWQSGASSGKAHWQNNKENVLEGKWGNGASADNGGAWNLTKSRTQINLPMTSESCRKNCEEQFDRCLRFSSTGMQCIASRSNCLMNCSSSRR